MRLSTIGHYLVGNRAAIMELGTDRSTPLVGGLLVVSAALARSYHTMDILAKPWHLLAPFAVSIVMASVLLLTICIGPRAATAGDSSWRPGFLRGRFLPFLGLVWMTAPLAWLYAVPYERLADPLTATEAKLWTLGAVSVWRLVLITRVLSVLSGRSVAATFFPVMLVADGVVWLALSVAKVPLIQFMGEIQLTASERYLADTVFLTRIAAFLSSPVWLLGAGIALFRPRTWTLGLSEWKNVSAGVRAVAGGAIAAGLLGLVWLQGEQRLATLTESLLQSGAIENGLLLMSDHRARDYPPQWEPPPRVGYGESTPPLLDVLETMAHTPAADWVREAYLSSFERRYLGGWTYDLNVAQWSRVLHLLDALPEGKALREKYKEAITSHDRQIGSGRDPGRDSDRPDGDAADGDLPRKNY